MMKNRSAAILAALLLFPATAFGQGAVLQSGLVVPGHTAAWLANGIIADSGYPSLTLNGPVSGQAVVWNGVTAIGAAGTASTPNPTYPLTALPVVAAGQPVCIYDAPSTGANHSLCLGTVGGVATITSAANNGASTGAFTIVNNGAVITLPTTTGGLIGSITAGTGIAITGTATVPIVSVDPTQMPTVFDSAFGSTPGDVLWRSPSGWAALGPGANGTCLTYNTSGPSVSWGSCAGSGGSGTVTSIATSGLVSGGTITTTGTISLAAIADGTLVGNVSGGSAVPTANTISAVLDKVSSTRGAILERGASAWGAITPGAANTVFTSAGSGADPAYVTLSAVIDAAIGSTRGSVLYRGASGWAILAPGTAGYALVSNGSGADPAYANVTSGLTQPTQSVLSTAGSGTYTVPGGAVGLHIRYIGGGGGGAGSTGNGGGGGSTTFGSFTAGGGGGGKSDGTTCTQATASGGTVNLSGGANPYLNTGQANPGSPGAFGGQGSRGAGGSSDNGGSPGCSGAYGEGWVNSPSASYSYAVGAAGTGGSSGGGTGTAGYIIIEVRYY